MVDVLLLVAVVAAEDAERLIHNVEDSGHWLVVGNALRVVALHNAMEFIGSDNGLFLYHLIVMNDAQHHIGCSHRQTGNLIVGEIAVAHLDDAFLPHLVGGIVETDGHRGGKVGESKEVDHLEGLVGGDMVDYGAVLDGGYESFFFVHGLSRGVGGVDDGGVVSHILKSDAEYIADDGFAGI